MKTISIGNCKNCQHWFGYSTASWGECNHPKVKIKPRWLHDGYDGIAFSASPGEPLTGKEFGCVHFKKQKSVV